MERYLPGIAKQLLKAQPDGLSKVRFAKMLYFVHKALFQKGLSKADDLSFIRMPLGPVPVGFMELSSDPEIKITVTPTSLSYNQQLYSIKHGLEAVRDQRSAVIFKIVEQLSHFSTSQLVEQSHKEHWWINHKNGDEYFLTVDDLAQPIPASNKKPLDPETDNQRLQSYLMKGMLDEIVESTALEYPD